MSSARQKTARQKTVTVAVRRKTTMRQTDKAPRSEPRVAPSRRAERRHARPGAGIKRSRAAMLKRAR
jgi:hypothetical protein